MTGRFRVVEFACLDSTSDEARRRALAGDAGNLWIVAARQTAGRGRRGRAWESPAGNLFASALLIDPCPVRRAPELGFVAGVALARAASDVGAPAARLKWPNDLVAANAKCAGLLVEGLTLAGSRFAAIVGVGVNCRVRPEGLAYPATHMSALAGRDVAPQAMLAALALRFEEALALWYRGANFAAVRAMWLANAEGLGGRLRIDNASGRREGTFEGLDEAGRLLFRGERGLERIEAADVWPLADSEAAPGAGPPLRAGRESREV